MHFLCTSLHLTDLMTWLLLFPALLAGIANPFQSGANAQLNKQLGQPLWATIIVYSTGFLRKAIPTEAFAGVSWWAWCGGLISLIPTVIGLLIAQKMGSGLFTGLTITASLVTSILLDQFGLMGFRQHSASPARFAGCALMIGGLWLIARF
jgi:transporter family-2 protein